MAEVTVGDVAVHGEVAPGFEDVAATLARHIAEAGAGGGAVCVYHRGAPVVDVWAGTKGRSGPAWERDTVSMSYSTTKGVASTALHICADRGLISYDEPVATYWPEFAQHGKDTITVRQVLCHEAGLYAIRTMIDDASVLGDWDAMVHVLEEATPVHEPGTANGYHAITFGNLVGELVRRVTGTPIEQFVLDEIAGPLGLDGLFIGLPVPERGRASGHFSLSSDALGLDDGADAMRKLAEQMNLPFDPERVADALAPTGVEEWFRSDAVLDAVVPAANGHFTARSLARMYAALAAGGTVDGVTLVSPETVATLSKVQNDRPDLVLSFPMLWRMGYHMAFTTEGIVTNGFGHAGLGGSGAWADPDSELAVAMTINRMAGGAVGDMRIAEIGGAALRATREL